MVDSELPLAKPAQRVALLGRLVEDDVLVSLAVVFVSMVWIPAAAMAVLYLAGTGHIWATAAIASAALLTLLWLFLFRKLTRGQSLLLAAIVIGITLLAGFVSLSFYDSTGDGRWYHEDAILGLLHGSNPVYEQIPADPPVWANHYPKASWYFSALVIHVFGNYQLGKIYNFLLILGCAAYSWSFFRRMGVSGIYRACLVGTTALASVSASQMLTYYIDGALSSLLSLMIMATISLVFFPARQDRLLLFVCASLGIGLKFTAIPYVGIIVLILIAARFFYARNKTPGLRKVLLADAGCMAAALLVGVFVIGFNPYVTNVQGGQHPLYPVMGANKIDFIDGQMPTALSGHAYNRFEKFYISFFSHSTEWVGSRTMFGISFKDTGLKIPFSVNLAELVAQAGPDIRLAGWGVFFSGISVASVILFVLMRGWRKCAPSVLAVVLIAVTTFANPECWMARYTPQIALLPVFLLIPGLCSAGRGRRSVAGVLCGILALNNLLLIGGATGLAFVKTKHFKESFAAIAGSSGQGEYWGYKLGTMHLIQFSGLSGIVICGEIPWSRSGQLPHGGIPVGMSLHGGPELILYKGTCAQRPTF
jgi:hypothetical protein